METLGTFAIILIGILGILLTILTILIPFYIFGIYNSARRQEKGIKDMTAAILSNRSVLQASLQAQNEIIKITWDIKNK